MSHRHSSSGAVTGGGAGGHVPPYCWDPSENCECCRKLPKLSTGGRFKMLSSGKIFDFSETFFGLSGKYCPCPPPQKKPMGPTAPLVSRKIERVLGSGNYLWGGAGLVNGENKDSTHLSYHNPNPWHVFIQRKTAKNSEMIWTQDFF
jgi:hypothetical protein